MNPLKNRKVLVMGLGKSGLSAVRLLLEKGAIVLGIDQNPHLRIDPSSFKEMPVTFKFGKHEEDDFLTSDLIVVSPGIPTKHPYLAKSRREGISVIGELELSSYFLSSEITFAITGTNGKSTTVTLLGEFLRRSGKKTFVGGNLGIPATEAVLYPPAGGWDAIVLEISSFQLETTQSFHPRMASILNITPDHRERYANIREYAKEKFNIFSNQEKEDYAFLNWDDPLIRNYPYSIRSKVTWFSQKEALSDGITLENDSIFYLLNQNKLKICQAGSALLKGSHHIENMMVASAMAFLSGVSSQAMEEVLAEFKGLEHRTEKVRELKGVTYINDSKGTNVGAVIRSLENVKGPVILIAGGREKGGGFLSLIPLIRRKVKTLLLIGEAKNTMKKELGGVTEILEAETLEEAVQKAFNISQEGDTVLFSPACSSYDMFRDYEERGEIFKKIVWSLG